jgi:hypothetical protein
LDGFWSLGLEVGGPDVFALNNPKTYKLKGNLPKNPISQYFNSKTRTKLAKHRCKHGKELAEQSVIKLVTIEETRRLLRRRRIGMMNSIVVESLINKGQVNLLEWLRLRSESGAQQTLNVCGIELAL